MRSFSLQRVCGRRAASRPNVANPSTRETPWIPKNVEVSSPARTRDPNTPCGARKTRPGRRPTSCLPSRRQPATRDSRRQSKKPRLDRPLVKDETETVRKHLLTTWLMLTPAILGTGCGALLLVGGAGTSAIAYAIGDLRSEEQTSLAELDLACGAAIESLGYGQIVVTRETEKIRWQARTPGGEPVDIRLAERGPARTQLRIRVGVFGNEAQSRLVLEQIHQSL